MYLEIFLADFAGPRLREISEALHRRTDLYGYKVGGSFDTFFFVWIITH